MGAQIAPLLRGTRYEGISFEPPGNIRPRTSGSGPDLSRHAAAMPDPLYTRFAPAVELSRMFQQLNGSYQPQQSLGSIGALGLGGLGSGAVDIGALGAPAIAQSFAEASIPPGIPAPDVSGGGGFGGLIGGFGNFGSMGFL